METVNVKSEEAQSQSLVSMAGRLLAVQSGDQPGHGTVTGSFILKAGRQLHVTVLRPSDDM
jgi:hypothetical protein